MPSRLLDLSDDGSGYARRRVGRGFSYRSARGQPLRAAKTVARIRALAIPPAWTQVWICPHPLGRLQATGRDARGRKQYVYHPLWKQVQDDSRHQRLLHLGQALPGIRRRVKHDLARRGLSRDKVLATVVRLLETSLIRVGNEEYARANGSFGLTTLKDRHARVRGGTIRFSYPGKSGIAHVLEVDDPRLAKLVRRCQELPGQELFQYIDDCDQVQDIRSTDVNDYLRAATGYDCTAKDFRTWMGTLQAAQLLSQAPEDLSVREARTACSRAVQTVAARLGNTAAVCRSSYIHPGVIQASMDGWLPRWWQQQRTKNASGKRIRGLSADEALLLRFLGRCDDFAAAAPK